MRTANLGCRVPVPVLATALLALADTSTGRCVFEGMEVVVPPVIEMA